MRVGDRPPSVELFHDGRKRGVAEILALIAAHEADAVGFERVVGVFDFAKRAVYVGQRHRREHAEPPRVICHQPGAVLVALPRELARCLVVTEPHARLARRDHGRGDAVPVHVLDGFCGCPGHERHLTRITRLDGLDETGRGEVAVDVDPVRSPGRSLGLHAEPPVWQQGRRASCGEPCQKAAA